MSVVHLQLSVAVMNVVCFLEVAIIHSGKKSVSVLYCYKYSSCIYQPLK